jgi:predicted transcriptional regulator
MNLCSLKTKARSKAVVSLVNQAFDGTVGSLMHFLVEEKKLSKKQLEELLKLLKNEDNRGGSK